MKLASRVNRTMFMAGFGTFGKSNRELTPRLTIFAVMPGLVSRLSPVQPEVLIRLLKESLVQGHLDKWEFRYFNETGRQSENVASLVRQQTTKAE